MKELPRAEHARRVSESLPDAQPHFPPFGTPLPEAVRCSQHAPEVIRHCHLPGAWLTALPPLGSIAARYVTTSRYFVHIRPLLPAGASEGHQRVRHEHIRQRAVAMKNPPRRAAGRSEPGIARDHRRGGCPLPFGTWGVAPCGLPGARFPHVGGAEQRNSRQLARRPSRRRAARRRRMRPRRRVPSRCTAAIAAASLILSWAECSRYELHEINAPQRRAVGKHGVSDAEGHYGHRTQRCPVAYIIANPSSLERLRVLFAT